MAFASNCIPKVFPLKWLSNFAGVEYAFKKKKVCFFFAFITSAGAFLHLALFDQTWGFPRRLGKQKPANRRHAVLQEIIFFLWRSTSRSKVVTLLNSKFWQPLDFRNLFACHIGLESSGVPNHCEDSSGFFSPKKMPWFCRGLVQLFCEGFFVSFPKPEIPEFFSFHWRLSRTFNGCQDAQDDDCLLGLGGV